MAVARMHKVSVIGHTSVIEEVVEQLQRAGVIEVTRTEIANRELPVVEPDPHRLHEIEARVADAQFVRDFLGRFHESDQAFGTFISEKVHISEADFEALGPDADFLSLYEECVGISDRLGTIDRERARLVAMIEDLAPWLTLHLQIQEWKGTEHVVLFTGTVPLSDAAEIRQALRETVEEMTVAEVGRDAYREAWVVLAHKDSVEDVRATLGLTTFTEASFPELTDYPAEESACAEEELSLLAGEESELIQRASELSAQHYKRSAALVQVLLSDLDAVEVRDCFAATERTFLVTGWIPERRRISLVAALAPVSSSVDVSFADPEPEDQVPVELVNHRLLRPFEVLTDLYGRPRYGEIDPTPILAPFFFLFFGMCLGDVGYGVILAAVALLIKKRLDVAPGVRKFMDLLALGGVASVAWGVLTRSYLALPVERLPALLTYKPLIDPQSELLLLLGTSIAIGVVHVSLGVGLAAMGSFRKGDAVEAISEHVSALLFVASLVFVVLGAFGVVPASLSGPVMLFAVLQLILLKGRVIDPFVGRAPYWTLALVPFKGFLGLYGMVGFGSDFLSYTRLAALGLASLYVGDAMNRLSVLASDIPWVGVVFGVAIFVVGHLFNVVINMLGAFVHPTRLQYVEFFGKFYEGGGRPFRPFAPRTERLVLHPRTAGEQEGGTAS